MERQNLGSFSFDGPDAWNAETLLEYLAPGNCPGSLAVSREARRAGEPPASHVARRVEELRRKHDAKLHGTDPLLLGGRPAWRARMAIGGAEHAFVFVTPPDASCFVVMRCESDAPAIDRAIASLRFLQEDNVARHRAARIGGFDPVPTIPIPGVWDRSR